MRRREFIALMGASVTWPFGAMAQEPGRTYRLGAVASSPRNAPHFEAMINELRRFGFIEGQNLTIDYRAFAAHFDLIPQYAAELVIAQPDVIYAGGGVAIRAVQQATKSIPIVGITDDMVQEGLVESFARPNGNTTGISFLATELDGKRQDILIEAVPGICCMAALADSSTLTEAKARALQAAARALKVELSIYRITRGEEIGATIDAAKGSGVAALNVLASPLLYGNRQLIMQRAAALGMPAIYQWPEEAEEGGGFAAYGPRLVQIFRDQMAPQLVKLLRGTKVADVPVEQPTKFELVINLKTANALGVTVPPTLLARTDKVIE